MDSINNQQAEDNFEDLYGSEAIEKIKVLVGKGGACLFCSDINTGRPVSTRPMSVQQFDDSGNFWFLSPNDSNKNEQVLQDEFVQLLFQGSSYSDFLSIYGSATISADKAKIKELWEPILKTWFTEGADDPRISVIKVKPLQGYYWDTKHNRVVGMVKRVVGALTGKTLDDSIEGKLKV